MKATKHKSYGRYLRKKEGLSIVITIITLFDINDQISLVRYLIFLHFNPIARGIVIM